MGPPSRRRSKDGTSRAHRDTSPDESPSLRTETVKDKWRRETPKTPLGRGTASERSTGAGADPETAKDPSSVHDYGRTACRRGTDGPGERHRVRGTTEISPSPRDEASESSIGENGESDIRGNHRSARSFLTVGRERRRAGSCEGLSERDLKTKLTGELFPDIRDDVSSTRCSSNRGTERTTTGSAANSSRCESSSSEVSWGAPVDAHHCLRPPALPHHVSRPQQEKRQVTESRDKGVSASSEVLTPGTSLAHWRQEIEKDESSSWYAPTRTPAVVEVERRSGLGNHDETQSASCRDKARQRYEESEERRPGTGTHRTPGGKEERERESLDNRGPFNRPRESKSTELERRTEDLENIRFSSISSLRGTRREGEQEDHERDTSPRQQAPRLALTPALRGRRQSPKIPTSRESSDVSEREEEDVSATRHSPGLTVGAPEHFASRERSATGHHTVDSTGSVSDASEAEDVAAGEARREVQEVKKTKGGMDMTLGRSGAAMPARSPRLSESTWKPEVSTENDTEFHGQEVFLRDEERGQDLRGIAVGRRRGESREKHSSPTEYFSKDRTVKGGSRSLVGDSLLKRIEESRHKMRRRFTRGRQTYSPSAQQSDGEDGGPCAMHVSHAERRAGESPAAAATHEPSRDTNAATDCDLGESRRLHLKSRSQSSDRGCLSAREEVDSETQDVRNKKGRRPVTCRTSRDGPRRDTQQPDGTSPPVQLRKPSDMWSTRRTSDTSRQRDTQRPPGLETHREESRTPSTHDLRSPLRRYESPCRYVERWSESGDWTRCPGYATERPTRIAPRTRVSVGTTGSRSTPDAPLSAERGGGSKTVHRGTGYPRRHFDFFQTAKHYTKDRGRKSRDEAGASRSSYSPPSAVASPWLLSRRAVPLEEQMQGRNRHVSQRQPSSPITSNSSALSDYSSLSDTSCGPEKLPYGDRSTVCNMRESGNSSGEERAPYPTGNSTPMRKLSRSPHSSYRQAFSGRRNPTPRGHSRDKRDHHNIGNTGARRTGVPRVGSTSESLVMSPRSPRQGRSNEKAGRGGDFRRSHTEKSHRENFDSHPRTSHSRRVWDVSTVEKANRNRSVKTQRVHPAGRRRGTEDLSVSGRSSIWCDDGSVARPHTTRSGGNEHVEHRQKKRELPASAPWKEEGETGSAFVLEEQPGSMRLSQSMDGDKGKTKTEDRPQTPLPSPLARVRNMQCSLETVIAQLKERHEFLDNQNVPSFPSPRPSMKRPAQLHENNSDSPRDGLPTRRALPEYTQSVLPSETTTTAATATDFTALPSNVQRWWNQSSTHDEMASLSRRLATARVCVNRAPSNPVFRGGATPGAFAPPLLLPYPQPVTQEAPSASCCPQLFQVPGVSCHPGQYIAFAGGPLLAGAQRVPGTTGRPAAYSDALFLRLWQESHGHKAHKVIQETSVACLPPHPWAASQGVEQQAETARCSRSGVPPTYSRAGTQTAAFIAPHLPSQTDWSCSSRCMKALPRSSAEGSVHPKPPVPPSRFEPPVQQVDEEISRSPQTFVVEPACCQPLSPSLFSKVATRRQEVRCPVPSGDGQSTYTRVTPPGTSPPLPTARFGVPTARDGISPCEAPVPGYPWARHGPTPEDGLDSRFSCETPGGSFGPTFGVFGGAVNSSLCAFGAAAVPSQECDPPFVPDGATSRPFPSPSWSALAAERHRVPQTRDAVTGGFPGAPSATFPISHSAGRGDPITSLQSGYPSQSGMCGAAGDQEEVERWIQSSGAAVPSHRLLQILQRRSNHHSPVVHQAGVRTEVPHILPAAPMANGEGNSGRRASSARYDGEPVSSMGTQIGQAGRLRAPAGPDNERLQSSFAWSSTGKGCPRSAGIGGSGLGPFGTNQLILAKLMDGLEAAHRRLQVTHGRRGSSHDSPGAPSKLAPVSGGAQAVARGREIFDSLNARWRRFKALEDSPESSRVVGSRSGPSSESPYSYSLETGHTENPMRQRYAVRDYHSPLGTAGFMGNPSGDIPWGGGPPAGEPSAAFRLKINTLNQRMASVVGREYELLHDLQRARQKWCSETSALPVRSPAAGDVGTSPSVHLTDGDREPVRRPAAPDSRAHPTSGHSPRPRLSVSPCGRTTHRLPNHSRETRSPKHSRLEAPPPTSGASGAPAASGRGGKGLSPRGLRSWSGDEQGRSQFSPSPSRELMKTISTAMVEGPAARGGPSAADTREHQSAEWPSGANLRHLSLPLSSVSRDYGGRQTEVDSPQQRPPFGLQNPERAQLLLSLDDGNSARPGSSSGLPLRPRLEPPQSFGRSRLREREELLRRRLTESETRAVAEETLKQAHCLDPILHTEEDELLQNISEHLKRQHR